MKRFSSRMTVTALAVALLAAPATAFGRDQVPARDANVWDWRAHQPTEAQVVHQEEAAGIAPTQSARESTAATVDQLYRQLQGGSHN
jgi:hypothetical protein